MCKCPAAGGRVLGETQSQVDAARAERAEGTCSELRTRTLAGAVLHWTLGRTLSLGSKGIRPLGIRGRAGGQGLGREWCCAEQCPLAPGGRGGISVGL